MITRKKGAPVGTPSYFAQQKQMNPTAANLQLRKICALVFHKFHQPFGGNSFGVPKLEMLVDIVWTVAHPRPQSLLTQAHIRRRIPKGTVMGQEKPPHRVRGFPIHGTFSYCHRSNSLPARFSTPKSEEPASWSLPSSEGRYLPERKWGPKSRGFAPLPNSRLSGVAFLRF